MCGCVGGGGGGARGGVTPHLQSVQPDGTTDILTKLQLGGITEGIVTGGLGTKTFGYYDDQSTTLNRVKRGFGKFMTTSSSR